jgi:hypothetical protein
MKAMISSTAADLPEHREQVVQACLRLGIFPIAMEQLPARDATGVDISLEMVDQADIYIGVYAWRYGWIPEGSEIFITELEFNHAVERKERGELQEILIFVMHEEHDIRARDVEADAVAQEKLRRFKQRASAGRIRKEFKNADELRGLVIQALAECRRLESLEGGRRNPSRTPSQIPIAPQPYVAHPYVLLQTKSVIGRQAELAELTDWITKNAQVSPDTRIFSVVAMGGMGKSALTWKWFQWVTPNKFPNFAGRMWWSFYESDAPWENFLISALAYTAGISEVEVRQLPPSEREDRLLQLLDKQPFLIVLDGLERILLAYARRDAAHLPDDEFDNQTANAIVSPTRLADDVRETYLEKHRLRQCADLRAGAFLRKLARVRASRFLLSTRLYPAELQTQSAQPLPGCHTLFLRGLTDEDALTLWRGFIGGERSGTSDELLSFFRAFNNYPLMLRALAGEVSQYRPAPGDFDRWRQDHPDFNPAALPLKNAKTHVLEFALQGLGEAQRRALHTLAAFRMPTTWDTLRAVLVGKEKKKCCQDDRALDATLRELEDRGLLGWDRGANRYDLHPVIRSVAWSELTSKAQVEIHKALNIYLQSLPALDQAEVKSLDELSSAIELYCNLISLHRFDDAFSIFRSRFETAAIYRLSHSRLCAELLEMLFPDDGQNLPRLREVSSQIATLNALAQCYQFCGEPGRSQPFFRSAIDLIQKEQAYRDLATVYYNCSWALRVTGQLRQSQFVSLTAVWISRCLHDTYREAIALQEAGLTLEARGDLRQAISALQRSLNSFKGMGDKTFEGIGIAGLAQLAIHKGNYSDGKNFADEAWLLSNNPFVEKDSICAARLQGEAALGLNDSITGFQRLSLRANKGAGRQLRRRGASRVNSLGRSLPHTKKIRRGA